jgi:predicted aspartyl protease
MGSTAMGKVLVQAKIENMEDLFAVRKGDMAPEEVRAVEIPDAVVDTGATLLSLPRRLIQELGLQKFRTRRAQTTAGIKDFDVYGTVQLTVQGRDCHVDVAELPDECPALIGQVPLELLDFVVDAVGQRLIGNPAHGGEHMFDLF